MMTRAPLLVLFLAILACGSALNGVKKSLETVHIESITQKIGYDNATYYRNIITDHNMRNMSVLQVQITSDSVVVRNSLGPFTKRISVSTNGIIEKSAGKKKKQVDTLKMTHKPGRNLNVYIVSSIEVVVKNDKGPFVNRETGSINALIQRDNSDATLQIVTLKTERKPLTDLCIFITTEKEVTVLNEVGPFTDKIHINSEGIVRKTGNIIRKAGNDDNDKLTDDFKIVRDNGTSLNAHISSNAGTIESATRNALEPVITRITDSITGIVGRLGDESLKLVTALRTAHKSITVSAKEANGNLATKLSSLKEIADASLTEIENSMPSAKMSLEVKAAMERLKTSLLQFQNLLTSFLAIRLPLSFHITIL